MAANVPEVPVPDPARRPDGGGLGRLCFRCGAVLRGAAAQDAKGRDVCGACATAQAAGASRSAQQADDARVVIDLGPTSGPRPVDRSPLSQSQVNQSQVNQSPGNQSLRDQTSREEGPLDVLGDSPAPRRLPPARPVPELEDMSQYAPANQYRPRVPSTEGDGAFLERTCAECGYSLEGINTDQCPECGHVNASRRRLDRSRVLQEESRRIARMEYAKPAAALGVGGMVVLAILAAGGEWSAVGLWIGGMPIRIAIGTLAYFLCCLWFFGFDAPWSLTGLRMAGTYAIADIPLAAAGLLHFGAAMPIAYLVSLALCAFMFVWLFELDPGDAWLLVAISAVVNVVIGVTLAVLGSMIF